MQYKTTPFDVALSLIEDKPLFVFSDENPADIKLLKQSIARLGVLHPVILHPSKSKRYKIVDGFKRVLISKELGFTSIPALLLEEKLPPQELLKIALFVRSEPLSITEKARVVGILNGLDFPRDRILKEFANFLEINSLNLLNFYLSISRYSPSLLNYISAHNLSLKQALAFEGLSPEEQEFFLRLALCLNLKGYDLQNILTDLKEIATGEGKKVIQIIDDLKLSFFLKDSKMNRREKINKIKALIQSRRFPLLTKINQRLSELRKKLNLGTKIKVDWDPKMEEEGLKITLRITHPASCQDLFNTILSRENRAIILRMLEVYYEGLSNKQSMD